MPAHGLATTTVGGVGAVAVAVALGAFAGLPGVAVGLGIVLVWFLLADLAAFAIAVVAVGTLVSPASFPGGDAVVADHLTVVATHVAALPLLIGETSRADRWLGVAGLTTLLAGALATVAIVAIALGDAVLIGAATLVVVVSVFAYALHRYGLLVAGVLESG